MGAALLAVHLSVTSLWAVITSNVNVDATNVLTTMPITGLGIHTSPYYNNLSHALSDDRLNEAGVTTLRFGGGGYADVLHWSVARSGSGITGNGLSPWWGQPGNFGYVGPGSDFGSFVRLLDQVNSGQAVVTVNYGSAMKIVGNQSQVPDFGGQPKEAAAWVAYANADASIYGTENDIVLGVDQQGNDWKTAGYWARLRASTAAQYQTWATTDGVFNSRNSFLAINSPEPVGIKYWEIGNETFGTAYYDNSSMATGYSVDYDLPYGNDRRGNPALSPAQYGQDVVEYSQLMKSIDPTIKIGAVLSTPPDDWDWDYYPKSGGPNNANNKHWNPEVLAVAKNDIDFAMVHWYPWAGNEYTDTNGNNVHDAGESVNNGASLLDMPRQKLGPMINGTAITPAKAQASAIGLPPPAFPTRKLWSPSSSTSAKFGTAAPTIRPITVLPPRPSSSPNPMPNGSTSASPACSISKCSRPIFFPMPAALSRAAPHSTLSRWLTSSPSPATSS